MSGSAGGAVPAPSADALAALPADAWAWLLPHVRAALHALEDGDRTPVTERLRAAPTSRLAGGRTRRELDALLARGGPLWRDVAARAGGGDDVPAAVRTLLRGETSRPEPAVPVSAAAAPADSPDDAAARLRLRVREVRVERDEARRRLEGALARAAAAERARAELETELTGAREETAALRRRLDDAAADRERAVERERRRRDAEVRALTDTVGELRRAEADRRASQRRRAEADAQAAARARAGATRELAEHRQGGRSRLVPGRPSRLPAGVAPGTTEAAELLLHAGRTVLVDGYNVSKQHQGELDLEAQRAWLVRTCAALATRRRVRPHVVFDGQGAGSSRPPAGGREVVVTFTPAGVTADDEVVLTVEATDGPVTVVTDDRELADRVRASGADVIGTVAFLSVTRRT